MLLVGRPAVGWANDAVQGWSKRLRPRGGLEEQVVAAEPVHGNPDRVRDREGERVLRAIGARDVLVALDERGERLDTAGFAALVEQGMARGRLCFALGGPYGHGDTVRAAAWRVVRLSDLVLNHEVARVVLVEQLYRALTLLDGTPYHH